MTIQWALACDPESVVHNGNSLMFAIAFEAFGRDPHEYVKTRSKPSALEVVHAPLHRRDRTVLAVKEFFENDQLMRTYSNKINQFVMGSDNIIKVPFETLVKTLVETAHANGGKLITHCIDLDLRAFCYSDLFYGTNLFPNGPYFKVNPVIRDWNTIKFVCSKRLFTTPRLNQKMLARYPDLIDGSLEALVMAIRQDYTFRQSHRPQDDVDLLIEVLDHVYTANVSKQDFWDLLRMDHDFYDNKPVTLFSSDNSRLRTVGVSFQETLKNQKD